MKMLAAFFAGFVTLAATSAQAGIIYEWRALNNETPREITLQLEFDRQTVKDGFFKMDVQPSTPAFPMAPDFGLISFRYSYLSEGRKTMSYFPREQSLRHGFGALKADLTFMPGHFLSGYIFMNDSEQAFEMKSVGRTFTVTYADSDAGMLGSGCGWVTNTPCYGAQGVIRRADVPEPASIALLAIGVAAIGAISSRVKR